MQEQSRNEVPEEEIDDQNRLASQETEIITRNCSGTLPDGLTSLENRTENKSLNSLTQSDRNENRGSEFSGENKTMNTCGRVFCIESHSNGRLYEEYIFKLSSNREMKLKYPVVLNNSETMVQMEFIDDEAEYEKAPLDRIMIFFKNIYASVNVKQTGVPCGTQTIRLKTLNRSTQTTVIGVKSFVRLNAGVTMLNSEKRAIERSLYNLERTVKSLKFNALNQARNMIDKDPQFRASDELFDCIRILS